MRFNDQIYIAPRYTKEEYINLNLSLDSDEATWQKAIDIFKARIEKRFFDKIDLLLENNNEDAFAAMAICCLLVETLAQFDDGSENYNGCSKSKYSKFLSDSLGIVEEESKLFYDYVRCGILHSAQTKENAILCLDGQGVLFNQDNSMFVDVEKFAGILKEYYKNYCDKLLSKQDENIRSNFVRKMDFICNR